MVKYSLRFAPEFLADLNGATEFYDTKRVGLGKKFRSEVKSKLAIIKKSYIYMLLGIMM